MELIGALCGILAAINFLVFVVVSMRVWCDEEYPVFCQPYLWFALDECNINLVGKLILCILTAPFTIGYTIGALMAWMGKGVVELFYLLFRKR